MNMKLVATLLAACTLAACANNNTVHTPNNSSVSPSTPQAAANPNTYGATTTHNQHGYTVTNHADQTAYNTAPAAFNRTFECDNGLTVRTTAPSDTLGLSVTHGVPKAAVVVLNRQGNGYGANMGLFGGGATWQENGNVATFGYVHPHSKQMVTTRCTK